VSWVVTAAVAGGLGVMLLVCFVASHVRQRRKARLLAQLWAQYQKQWPTLSSGTTTMAEAARTNPAVANAGPGRNVKVTVDELVARIEAEGLPVRLRWDEPTP
jgi:hypothetical protein